MFRVKAENFLSYKTLDFDFSNRGLCLIEGQNKEEPSCKSNGAGKTSLIDSLCWGLYGKSFKVVAADKVVNIKEGGNCMVEVSWDDYRVVRYRKHNKFKNDLQIYHYDKDITAKSNKDTQELIDNAIGLSYESFVNSVYFQQNNLTTFATATDSEQKAIIENILGFKVLSEAQVVARESVKEFDISIAKLEQELKQQQFMETDRRTRIKSCNFQSGVFESQRSANINTILHTIDGLENKKNTSVAEFDVEEAKQMIEAASVMPKLVQSLEKEMNGLIKDLALREQNYSHVEQAALSRIALFKKKDKQKEEYKNKPSPVCITCNQPIGADKYEVALATMYQELVDIQEEVTKYDNELQKMVPIEAFAEKIKILATDIKSKKDIVDLAERLQRKVMAEEYRLKEMGLIDQQIEHQKVTLAELQSKTNPYQSQVEEAYKELEGFLSAIDGINGLIKNKQTERSYYEYWVDGLANSKLKSYIMDSITPLLNERANYYAGFLTGGSIQIEISTQTKLKNGEMRDKFSVNIDSATGADYELCSGGEKKRIDICILLSLQDLVRSRAKQPLNLVIFDEVAENLDEVGIERLIDMLHNIGSERGTCLYVTHSEDMKPLFPNIVTVVKQNGQSFIVDDKQ